MRKYTLLWIAICLFTMATSVSMAAEISRGASGGQVTKVQKLLINQGYLVDKADGIFGNNTEYAVRAFQKSKNLKVTGIVNDKTMSAMEENDKLFTKKEKVAGSVKGVKLGDRGSAVEDIQLRLANSGFNPGDIDGVFGEGTENAVNRFQRHHGLEVTGVVDNKTKELLSQERGLPENYSKVIEMEATAYSSEDPGNGNYTARGNLLRKGLVSVDPDVIPLGTELYIVGYGYAVADDTGGAIQGHRIDLGMDSHSEAIQFGRRDVKVYILK